VKKADLRSARIKINSTAEIIPVTVKKRSILNKYAAAKRRFFVFSSLLYMSIPCFLKLFQWSKSF